MAFPSGRLLVALNANTLVWDPVWTALDQAHPNLVTNYRIDRGRQYELDRTDTGRAVVEIADPDGTLDPTNTAGPYYGKLNPLKQVVIRRYNPVAAEWDTRFRGFIEEMSYGLDPSQHVYRLTLQLVDLFEVLAAMQMQPGRFGHDSSGTAIAEDVKGQVWYGPWELGPGLVREWWHGQPMKDRIVAILDDADIPAAYTAVFSGNVIVQPTTYSPGESPLTAIQETADAEFPGVSNVYCDRHGRLAVHGRLAKFDPAGVLAPPGATDNWDYHQWKAGDGGWVASAPAQYAHVREFAFNRGLAKIINTALATPAGIHDDDVAGQLVEDATSQGKYGIRSWSAESLITKSGMLGPTTGLEETKRFATYYRDNYKDPQNRIAQVVFRSLAPGTPGASENWRLLSKVDISDSIEISVDAPSGGGFVAVPYFVEGVRETCRPLNPGYDDVTLSLDLSPRAYFDTNPWA